MRLKPNIVVRKAVRNKSSRDGTEPTIIVLHSTESHNRPGKSDLESIAAWFNNPAAQASSHVVVDADGTSARLVDDRLKAWTCAGYNAVSLNVEQIGFANSGTWADDELAETARWIAHWSLKHGIPIQTAQVSGGRVTKPGVIAHSQLGSIGGGHSDPGAAYPMKRVLGQATSIKRQLKEKP